MYIDVVYVARRCRQAARRRAGGGAVARGEREGDSGATPRRRSAPHGCFITVCLWNLCENGDCLDGEDISGWWVARCGDLLDIAPLRVAITRGRRSGVRRCRRAAAFGPRFPRMASVGEPQPFKTYLPSERVPRRYHSSPCAVSITYILRYTYHGYLCCVRIPHFDRTYAS